MTRNCRDQCPVCEQDFPPAELSYAWLWYEGPIFDEVALGADDRFFLAICADCHENLEAELILREMRLEAYYPQSYGDGLRQGLYQNPTPEEWDVRIDLSFRYQRDLFDPELPNR